jgi:hypothetical protein
VEMGMKMSRCQVPAIPVILDSYSWGRQMSPLGYLGPGLALFTFNCSRPKRKIAPKNLEVTLWQLQRSFACCVGDKFCTNICMQGFPQHCGSV